MQILLFDPNWIQTQIQMVQHKWIQPVDSSIRETKQTKQIGI